MPGASSMRGITGYRLSDVMNGALAQLIPDRVPAAGEGGSTLAFFTGTRRAGAVRLQRARRRDVGRPPGRRRERRAREPVRQHGEHPRGAGRERLADHDRALRPRHRLGRSRPLPRRARRRARLAGTRARDGRPRPLRPAGPPSLRPGGRAGRRSFVEPALPRRRDARADAADVRRASSQPGDVLHHRMPGGGGWGSPFEREPEAVAEDVLDEKISVAAARELYGVVVDRRTARSTPPRPTICGARRCRRDRSGLGALRLGRWGPGEHRPRARARVSRRPRGRARVHRAGGARRQPRAPPRGRLGRARRRDRARRRRRAAGRALRRDHRDSRPGAGDRGARARRRHPRPGRDRGARASRLLPRHLAARARPRMGPAPSASRSSSTGSRSIPATSSAPTPTVWRSSPPPRAPPSRPTSPRSRPVSRRSSPRSAAARRPSTSTG